MESVLGDGIKERQLVRIHRPLAEWTFTKLERHLRTLRGYSWVLRRVAVDGLPMCLLSSLHSKVAEDDDDVAGVSGKDR